MADGAEGAGEGGLGGALRFAQAAGTDLQAVRAAAEKAIPLGRYGTTEEFGRAAAFLLSDAASYITGSSLALDGGALRTVW